MIRLFSSSSILDTFCQRDQAKKNDNSNKANHNAYNHFTPYHAEAHSNTQRQSAHNTDNDGQDGFSCNVKRFLMFHLSPDNQCNKAKKQANTTENNTRLKSVPLRDKSHAHSQRKQNDADCSQYHCYKTAFFHLICTSKILKQQLLFAYKSSIIDL